MQLVHYVLAIFTGSLLGGFFFAGLRWTVSRLPHVNHPVVLFLASGLVRTAVAVSGIWLVGRGDPIAMMCCLIGFMISRLVLVRGMPIADSLEKRPAQ